MRFFRISRFLRRFFFANVLRFFGFLSLLLARSRRAVANLEERVKKFIDTAFFWPVEVGEILMRLLIVNLNKLVWIISRRNRHVPAGDFARHSLWYPWKGYEHRWCEWITWQFVVCNDDWDDDSFLTKRSIRTIRVFLVCCARGPGFRVGGKIVFLADLARFCLCIVYKTLFCEKRDFGRLRSCSYSRERARRSLLKVS